MAPGNAAMEAANLTPRRENTGLFPRLPNPLNLFRSPSKLLATQEEVLEEEQEDEDTIVRQPRGSIPSEEEDDETEIIEQRGFTPSDGEAAILQREEEQVQEDSESERPQVPIQPPKRKRVERRDEYAVPVEESKGEEPVVISRKLKGARTTKPTAKKPLVQPKSTKGPIPRKMRITQANGEHSTASESSNSVPASDAAVINGITNGGEGPSDQSTLSKRRRGRPKRNKDPPPVLAEELAKNTPVVEEADRTNKGKEPASPILDPDGGNTSLLMNPSPIKPPHLPPRAVKSKKGKEKQSSDDSDEEERPDDNGPVARRTVEPDSPEAEDGDAVSDGDHEEPLIDLKGLRGMWRAAKRVGYRRVGNSWEVQRSEDKLYSIPGRRINPKAKNLTIQYRTMLQVSVGQDMTPLQEAQANIDFVLPALETEIRTMISRLNCAESKKVNVPSLLTDLYFNIVPNMLETILAFAKAKSGQEKIRTEDLQEFKRLVQMLYDVAVAGIEQKPEHQPKPENKRNSYQTKKPTRNEVIPELRKILKKVKTELDARERARAKAEYDRLEPERERRRREEQARNDLEDARRRKEIHRLQREAYEAKLKEPFWGDMLSTSLEMVRADRNGSLPRSRSRTTYRRYDDEDDEDEDEDGNDENQDVDDDGDPFADQDEEPIERISVFGNNNNKNADHFKELTFEEREIFVKEMMTSIDDKDKYQRAAEALDRNIDEIFGFAQELQDHMHRMHEEGFYREPEDQWTHYIVQ
ncbi:hypothetical protein BDZ45DRAFT_721433 [Acephala macrosclerotiorum]|nr:hypothetical protein BDZ45DRAFT_721433 [Acephala macrosclerotiorum]